jgi:hypothetical protein
MLPTPKFSHGLGAAKPGIQINFTKKVDNVYIRQCKSMQKIRG